MTKFYFLSEKRLIRVDDKNRETVVAIIYNKKLAKEIYCLLNDYV